MECAAPSNRVTLKVKITRDAIAHRKIVTLDKSGLARIKNWNAAACVYVIVSNKIIQYVGCSSSNFFVRFTNGISQAHAKGYRWPTYDGPYQLFIWKIDQPRYFVEAVEAEVAFLHRAVLGDWPIELNQISPKRHLVHAEASAFGKSLAFGIYSWLIRKGHVISGGNDVAFLRVLRDRSIIC
jgi:hypothetical protein